MGYRIRQIETEGQFCEAVTMDALTQHIRLEIIEQVVAECQVKERRKRKLPATLLVLLCVGMNLFSHDSLGYVLLRLVRGLRLVAVDGTTETVPDTVANDVYFGRLKGDRGDSAFPLVRCVYLCECGTHAIFDAGFWPYHTHEVVGGRRLLRSVEADMLVMWDRGFHDFDMFLGATQRGGQILSRLPAHVKPRHVLTLPDGTWLGFIYPSDYGRRKRGERLLVRIITYELDDPHRPGHQVQSRLITTLLHPELYPALDLVCLYHERWEPDRLSFLNSLRLIGDAIPDFQLVDPVDHPRHLPWY